jgi:hypothetical protein
MERAVFKTVGNNDVHPKALLPTISINGKNI